MAGLAAAAFGGAAKGAPFAVLYRGPDDVMAVDVASIQRDGAKVRYETVTILRVPAELEGTPDEVHHWKETDCAAGGTRLLRMAMRQAGGELETPPWAEGGQEPTEIDPAEQRLLCEQAPTEVTLDSVGALREALGKTPGP